MKTMTSFKPMVYLVAVLALAVLSIANVSALAQITSVEVNGAEALGGANIAAFAGQNLLVKVIFKTDSFADDIRDVRVKTSISGGKDVSVSTERFDVLGNETYSRLLSVPVPFDIDPNEPLTLFVSVESRNNGELDRATINLGAQRESFVLEVLDVNMDSQVSAGSSLIADVALKNRGRHFAEDTFVRARIPALGLETRVFFQDLAPTDQPILPGSTDRINKDDSASERLVLKIPANTPPGVYTVEFEAFNADTTTTVTKKIVVVGAGADTMVVSPRNSQTFAPGEKATYSITLVNSGDKIRVYELSVDSPSGLSVDIDEPLVAIPAGSSKTVKVTASAINAGRYSFAVNVRSDNELVKTESFGANIEGVSKTSIGAGNTTVILTVVLAIIFVVLLVVLIVLLTRRPEKKTEEFGESYY